VSKRSRKPRTNFVAFVPFQIEPGDNYGSHLVGLPLNIMFGGFMKDRQSGRQSFLGLCYWPAPDTFLEDSERKEMCYFTKPQNNYFVRVTFEKNTGRWRTKKLKGKKLIRLAVGPGFDITMIHTTMGGLEPDELDCTT